MKCIYKIFCPHYGRKKIEAKKQNRRKQVERNRYSQAERNRYSNTDPNHFRLLEESNSPDRTTGHTTFGSSSNCSTVPSMPAMPVTEVGLAPSGSDEVSALSLQSANVLYPYSPEVKAWIEQKERREARNQEALNDEDSRTAYTRAEI